MKLIKLAINLFRLLHYYNHLFVIFVLTKFPESWYFWIWGHSS